MKSKLHIICAVVIGAALAIPAMAEHPHKMKMQSTCPIMGGKVKKNLYVDANGKRIYVCCPGCIGKVKKDPAAALKKIAAKGETAASLQTKCPVMGGKINPKLYADVDGKRIYVCCPGCVGKIKKDPKKYIKKIEDAHEVVSDIPKKMEGMHHDMDHDMGGMHHH